MCLALALILPLITGQIRTVGNMLCPMHIPVLLCGFICGPVWGLAIGFAAPFLRILCFGMPALFPNAVGMAFELAAFDLCRVYKNGKKLPGDVINQHRYYLPFIFPYFVLFADIIGFSVCFIQLSEKYTVG